MHAIDQLIRKVTGAVSVSRQQVLQSLWSGYGEIVRYRLAGCARPSVIVKHVNVRSPGGDLSHRRKMRSYQVEALWYRQWSGLCDEGCRVAECLAAQTIGEETWLVLEDLDAAGFDRRCGRPGDREIAAGLSWLAHFHAAFLGRPADGLWPCGTYWHLETRPDEWRAMPVGALKQAAAAIDAQLKQCRYQTLVHGDAKLANFCFTPDGLRVAAVDFQYVGGGCGIKDVAYFLDSCLAEDDCQRQEQRWLDHYFQVLDSALRQRQPVVDPVAVELEWRAMYPAAWTDFQRFLQGWSPAYRRLGPYSSRLAQMTLEGLPNCLGGGDDIVGG